MYLDENKKFMGKAKIIFTNPEDARNAQKAMNKKVLANNEIVVVLLSQMRESLSSKSNLMIRNLDQSITQRQLERECSAYGTLTSCLIKKKLDGGLYKSLGYGYISFKEEADALRFLSDFNGKELNGKKVVVQKFIPNSERIKPNADKNLYLKNFPSKMTKEQVEQFLQEKFSPFGKIEQKGVYQDKGQGHFYAFVAFQTTESAKKAIEGMNGYKESGSSEEPLYVGPAQTKK